MEEEWRAVPGYEGLYEVSNLGRVKSLDKTVERTSRKGRKFYVPWKGRILKLSAGSKGHYRVNLYSDDGPEMIYVHQLVAQVYVPNPEGLPLVRHLDDIKEHNQASNLAWGTHADNRADALRNGVKYGPARGTEKYCKYGHRYTEANTYINPKGLRTCRKCKKNFWRRKNGLPLDLAAE